MSGKIKSSNGVFSINISHDRRNTSIINSANTGKVISLNDSPKTHSEKFYNTIAMLSKDK